MVFSKPPNDRRATKAVLTSRTVLCSLVGMGVSIAGLLGYGAVSELLLPFFTLLSSFGTFFFRIIATKMIG